MVQVETRPHHKHQVLTLHVDLLELLSNKLKYLFHNINVLFLILCYVGPPIIRSTALARPEITMEARRGQTIARKRKRMVRKNIAFVEITTYYATGIKLKNAIIVRMQL